jgi:hypothetical protein
MQTFGYLSRACDVVVWLWVEYSKVLITDFQLQWQFIVNVDSFLWFLHKWHWALLLLFWQNLLFVLIVKVCKGQIALSYRGRQPPALTGGEEGACALSKSVGTLIRELLQNSFLQGHIHQNSATQKVFLHYVPLTCGKCCGSENGCFAVVFCSLSYWSGLSIIPSPLSRVQGLAYILVFQTLSWRQPVPPQHQQHILKDRVSLKNDAVIHYVT